MGFITKAYEKNFLQRFDKDDAVPYYCASDFPGLLCEENSFINSAGVTVKYFTYNYNGYNDDKLVLFCHGMGPGHTAYLAEIETLCRARCRVLTLDYSGCGASGGERMTSVNSPVRDVAELLDLLHLRKEIIPVGHSLGGYTALTVANMNPAIKRAVVISGFVNISDVMMGFLKLRFLAKRVKRYEKKLDPRFGALDNRKYLAQTEDKILWIHSTDDPMVNYKYNAGQVIKLNNPNVRVITVENKKHNPQYKAESLADMNAWMGEYYRLVREKRLDTPEARKAYFADKPVSRMTAQDEEVFGEILRFIGS